MRRGSPMRRKSARISLCLIMSAGLLYWSSQKSTYIVIRLPTTNGISGLQSGFDETSDATYKCCVIRIELNLVTARDLHSSQCKWWERAPWGGREFSNPTRGRDSDPITRCRKTACLEEPLPQQVAVRFRHTP